VLGQVVESAQLFSEALSASAEAGDVRRQARAQLGLACLDIWAGNVDPALARCEIVRGMALSEASLKSRLLLLEALGMRRPGLAEALGPLIDAKLNSALSEAEKAESVPDLSAILLAQAFQLFDMGQKEEAASRAAMVLSRVDGGRIPLVELVALRLQRQCEDGDASRDERIGSLTVWLEGQVPATLASAADFRKTLFPLP